MYTHVIRRHWIRFLSWYNYGLRDGRPLFDSLQEQDFSLHSVETGSGARSASYPMGTGGSFRGVKAAGA
jgi:hypothetical protein